MSRSTIRDSGMRFLESATSNCVHMGFGCSQGAPFFYTSLGGARGSLWGWGWEGEWRGVGPPAAALDTCIEITINFGLKSGKAVKFLRSPNKKRRAPPKRSIKEKGAPREHPKTL